MKKVTQMIPKYIFYSICIYDILDMFSILDS